MFLLLVALVPLASCQMLLGGPVAVSVDRDDIQEMATFATAQLGKLDGTQKSLVKVEYAATQVVAGTNYILTLQVQDGSSVRICNVTIWYRPWLNDKRVTKHICSPHKRAAVMPGGYTTVNVHRADVREMAGFAVAKVNELTNSKNNLVEIESASEQIVSGMNYNLTLRIQEGTNIQRCNVIVYSQTWTGTTQLTYRNCKSVHAKRQMMPGGLNTVDVHSDSIQKMAAFALSEINGLQGTQNTLEEVISAKTQVVAGINYVLAIKLTSNGKSQICNVKIWSQPWTNTLQMTEHRCSQVTKRAGALGSPTQVDLTDPELQKMAAFAVSELNGLQSQQNSLVKIVSARKQIVAGVNYFLKLSLQNGGKTQICDVEIWYQAWTHMQTLLHHKCSAGAAKRSLLGGREPASLSQPVQDAIAFAEDALNSKSNNLFRMVTQTVDNITRQIVAGIKYTFDLHLVSSTCSNDSTNKGKSLQACPANTAVVQKQTCTVTVLSQMWSTPKYQLLSDTCGQMS